MSPECRLDELSAGYSGLLGERRIERRFATQLGLLTEDQIKVWLHEECRA
jgi:hypothetical protein